MVLPFDHQATEVYRSLKKVWAGPKTPCLPLTQVRRLLADLSCCADGQEATKGRLRSRAQVQQEVGVGGGQEDTDSA